MHIGDDIFNFDDASCCMVDVVNGGSAWLELVDFFTSSTTICAALTAAATFSAAFPERSFGGMRVGLGLYGYGVEGTLPALEVKSSITRVNRLMAGDTVGYGGMFRAKRACVVATVPVGYADGLYRSYTGGEVLVNGSFAKIVGNVCMDCCFVLVGEGAKPGDEVVFLGRQGAKEISAERIASKLGTIPYEVLTSFRRMNTIYCGFAPKSN